jgi:Ca-activated chloride channel family protein
MLGGRRTSWISRAAALALLAGVLSIGGSVAVADDESVLGQDGGSLILVLDGSGSMKEAAGGGRSRMEAAKDGLNGVVGKLPQNSKVGLRVYGSTIEDGKGSCQDTELLAPVDEVDEDALRSGINQLKPLGNTPIAYSLKKAFADLPSEGPRSIVLVSDGEENCGGDPCKVARDLKKKGAEFYVDVVGLQLSGKARDQMTCIASAGGGTYYDVKDLEQLTSTLTRTSVRAARGYEPSGLPVEGGTQASNAAAIDDGQWLDTIGDSGTEFYRVPDPGKGTVHVSAAQPRTGTFFAGESLSLTLSSASGKECGDGAYNASGGSDEGNAPVTIAQSFTVDDRKNCGKGPYRLAVTSKQVRGVASLEVLVRTEPEVTDVDELPPPTSPTGDEVRGDEPAADPVSVIGGPNFSSAPPTAPGTYSDNLLIGEVLYYRVPDVQWGQRVVCDVTVEPTDAAADAFKLSGGSTPISTSVFSPLKRDTLIGGPTSVGRYPGDEAVSFTAASPEVRYRNREATSKVADTALDGDYYCQVNSLEPKDAPISRMGEVPFTLTVSVVGDETGEPDYASDPKQAADDEGDSGLGWPWIIGGLLVLAVLAAGLLAALRRRRGDVDDKPVT